MYNYRDIDEILRRLPKDARVASFRFLKNTSQRYRNSKKNFVWTAVHAYWSLPPDYYQCLHQTDLLSKCWRNVVSDAVSEDGRSRLPLSRSVRYDCNQFSSVPHCPARNGGQNQKQHWHRICHLNQTLHWDPSKLRVTLDQYLWSEQGNYGHTVGLSNSNKVIVAKSVKMNRIYQFQLLLPHYVLHFGRYVVVAKTLSLA